MSTTNLTAAEFAESMTGFDEIAIAKAFGGEALTLSDLRQMRALIFLHFRREGQNDSTAFESAMTLTLKQVGEFFADEPDDVMPEEPDSESGKGE